jgi:tetratricopeptide (TPR) repeat protein
VIRRPALVLAQPLALMLLAGAALAQPDTPEPPEPGRMFDMVRREQAGATDPGEPELSPAVAAFLEAPYHSEEERRALRIEHGVWTPEDLATPELRARAALIAGAIDDPALDDDDASAVDRAEALVLRGEPERALGVLAGESSMRAIRLRTQALFDLARYDAAVAAVDPVIARLSRNAEPDGNALAEGVRALVIRARVRGSDAAGGGDFRAMTQLLSRARERAPLSWRVRLAEAELLFEKHNNAGAAQAATEALALCPRSAGATEMLGRIAISAFDIDRAELTADRLDELASLAAGNADARSITAADLRARALLRQRSPIEAGAAIDAALERAPTQRALLALRAAAAAAGFSTDARDRWLDHLDGLSPGTALGLFEVGAALSEARQYEDAAGFLRASAERLPGWSPPWIELGLLEVQAGNDEPAFAALTRARSLDPFDLRVGNSLELVRELMTYDVIEGDHFAVRFKPGIDELLAREMLPVLDEIHDRVAAQPEDVPGGLGHEPDRKTLIELMPNHRWFSVRITGMTRIHTIAAATGPVIAMESPQVGPGFTNGPFDWPRVLQHEYGHTVALSRTKNRVPHWFTEAASVALEDAPRDMNTWRLLARAFDTDQLFDLEQINIAFVRPEKPTDRAQAYAQGHWMYQYIQRTFGPRAALNLMDRYAAGEDEASAFEAELGVDRGAFLSGFNAWARADLERVGMLPPADAPTVPEMIRADSRDLPEGERAQPDRAFLDRWLPNHPRHPDLLELSARIALDGSPPADGGALTPEVIEALLSYADVRTVDDWPHRLLARHFLGFEGDERFGALPHLAFLDAREQGSTVYAAARARLLAERGDHADAQAAAERATRIAPFDADARELAARVALVAGDPATARRHIEALVFLEPDRDVHRRRLEAVTRLAGEG